MTSREYIQEFIRALELQLEKKKNEPQRIPVLEIKPKGEMGDKKLYTILLENGSPPEGIDLELEIGGKRVGCELVSFSPPRYVVSVLEPLPEAAGNRYLRYQDTQLLEALIRRCRSICDYDRFAVSERVFNGEPQVMRSSGQNLPLSLNPHQKAAAEFAFGGDCIIWGPPGTGKTQTIAAAMTMHLEAGNRSLLLSHANTAVDGAFRRLAANLKDTDVYREGRIIRLGTCEDSLIQEFPMVSLEVVAEKKSKALHSELAELQNSLADLQKERERQGRAQAAADAALRAKEEYHQASKQLMILETKQSHLKIQIKETEERISQGQRELEQTRRSILKRIFGKSPERLEQDIWNLEENLRLQKIQFTETEGQKENAKADQRRCASEVNEKEKAKTALLSDLEISQEELKTRIQNTDQQIKAVQDKIQQKEREIDGVRSQILKDAVIVGTTLTRTYCSDDLWNERFDCVFVDEVSMAPLPQLFLALGLAEKQCTLIGDFLQLPPIGANIPKEKDPERLAKKWLDQNLFQAVGLDSVAACRNAVSVSPLKTQYRMNPKIAGIVNELFYGGMLENGANTAGEIYSDPFSGDSPLVFVDTSSVRPGAVNSRGAGTINLYHAVVASHLTVQYLTKDQEITVGVATQYRRQANIIREMIQERCRAKGMETNRVSVNTIHSFQGGECDIIIYDSVESYGSARNPWLLKRQNPHIELLLNVAVTRAKKKFILLANKQFIVEKFEEKEPFRKVMDNVAENGITVDSAGIDPYFKNVQDLMLERAVKERCQIGHYNEATFWGRFLSDIEAAQKRIILFCPFLSGKRIQMLESYFMDAALRKVQITLISRKVEDHAADYQPVARNLLRRLSQYPIDIRLKQWMHHKIVLIDDALVWEGSMNVLSTYRTGEQMVRIENAKVVKDIEACTPLYEVLQIPCELFIN